MADISETLISSKMSIFDDKGLEVGCKSEGVGQTPGQDASPYFYAIEAEYKNKAERRSIKFCRPLRMNSEIQNLDFSDLFHLLKWAKRTLEVIEPLRLVISNYFYNQSRDLTLDVKATLAHFFAFFLNNNN